MSLVEKAVASKQYGTGHRQADVLDKVGGGSGASLAGAVV